MCDSEKLYDTLLLCVIENRADDFIKGFQNQKTLSDPEALSLYQAAYANKILLSSTDWVKSFLPIVEKSREGNTRILKYLESTITIPADYHTRFCKSLKSLFRAEDLSKILLHGTLDELVKKGYREIDCQLYVAGIQFDFDRVATLLSRGADPFVPIDGEFTPEEAEDKEGEIDGVESLESFASRHAWVSFSANGIDEHWENGVSGKECAILDEYILSALFSIVGNKLVLDLIDKYCFGEKVQAEEDGLS